MLYCTDYRESAYEMAKEMRTGVEEGSILIVKGVDIEAYSKGARKQWSLPSGKKFSVTVTSASSGQDSRAARRDG